jgi:PAS domain-containing protein/ABC-type uncharacterized transport system substrate-binding protein
MLATRLARPSYPDPRPAPPCGARRCLPAWCPLAVLCLLLLGVAPVSAELPKNVLVLTTEATSMPGVALVVDGAVSALRASGPVNIYVESIDRSHSPEDTQQLAAIYKQRYADRRLDLVVTVCAPALNFALRHRDELFSGVPIVFSFVDSGMVRPFGPDAAMTGVFLDAGFRNLIGQALTLHPGVRRMLVVSGVSEFDRSWQASVERVIPAFESRLSTRYLTDMPLRDLLGELATAPHDSFVLYVSLSRDSTGATYVPRDVLDMIRRVSPVPVYGPSSTYLGHGAVGGALMDIEAHASDVGRMAVRVLEGEPADRIKPVTTASKLAFDWRELQRFGVREGALPLGAAVLYRDPAFWTVHERWVIATLCLVGAQACLIGLMLAQRRKRNSLQARLAARLRFETLLSDVSAALGAVPTDHMERTAKAALATIRRYFGVDRISVFELTPDARAARTLDDCKPGSPAVAGSYALEDMPSITLTLSSLQAFVMEKVDDLPQEAALERAVMQAGGIRSLVMVPLDVGGQALGTLSCVSHSRQTQWPADRVQQLRTLGQALANVVQRRQTDAAVREGDRLKGAVLSSMPAHIAVLDRQGVIIAVNEAWTAYGRTNGVRDEVLISPGANYLGVCRRAASDGAGGAAEACAGIEAVCDGRSESFDTEYRCGSDGCERWFGMKAVPLRRPEGGAVVTHRDISEQKRQEMALRDLTGRLISAQEDERRRIARDLHDDLQQRLALLAIELDGIALGHSVLSGKEVATRARDLWRQTTEVSTELHQLSYRLHPSKLEALGLLATVQGYCRELSQRGLRVTFTHDGVPSAIPDDVALCVFRIVQESLQNVVKHSGVTDARMTMSGADGSLRLVVADAGRGFDVGAALNRGGLGLISMRERMNLVGGNMTIRSVPGSGTYMEFQVPLPKDESSVGAADVTSARI